MDIITLIVGLAVIALIVAFIYSKQVLAVDIKIGSTEAEFKRMTHISGAIQEGAMSFLKTEYQYIAVFMAIFSVLMLFLLDNSATPDLNEGLYTTLAFIAGGLISLLAGYNGMKIATKANFRTTHKARESVAAAFDIAFKAGSVMGFALVGMALLGLVGMVVLYTNLLPGLEKLI